MEQRKGLNFFFTMIAIIVGGSLIKEYNVEKRTFENGDGAAYSAAKAKPAAFAQWRMQPQQVSAATGKALHGDEHPAERDSRHRPGRG